MVKEDSIEKWVSAVLVSSSAYTFFLQFYGQEPTLEPGLISQLCSLIPEGPLSVI